MADRRLSEAVVVYIWGQPRLLPYPGEHPEDVGNAFGDDAADLVSRVNAILDEAYSEPMVLPGEELKDSADRIAAVIGSRHPELDDQAVRAVANHVAFNTKEDRLVRGMSGRR